MSEPFALYVHVPWCRHVCPYCDFNVHASSRPPERAYAEALAGELRAHARRPPWAGRRVRSVYVGGGTPSLFSPGAIGVVLDAAARTCGIEPAAEVTLEANPGTVTAASLRGYRAAGVNRLSLGAQSFHAEHLRTLGRDHAPTDTAAAVGAARAADFENVNLDLIYATPGMTLADWQRDLEAAIALGPEHISAYGLTYEAATPFHAWRASGRLQAVDEDTEAAMAETTVSALRAAGYARYEISSWARPGFESRHNVSYWDGSDYLGIGAGAHSFAGSPPPGRRWANVRSPEAYDAAVRTGGLAVDQEEHLTERAARGDFMITGLRQIAGVDLAAFRRRFAADVAAVFPVVASLVGEGLLELTGERLRLTARGLVFADTVSAAFV